MTDKKDDALKAAADKASADLSKAGDLKRPQATIDLKATELASKTIRPDGAAKPADAAKPDASKTDAKAPAAAATQPADTKSAPGKAADSKSADPKATASKAPDPKSADASKAKAATPPPRPPARSGGIGATLTHMIAGIVGGAMAWYGATTLGPQFGVLPGGVDPKTTEAVGLKVAALEKMIIERTAVPAGDLTAKLTAAQGQIAKLEAALKSVADLNAAQAKLAADTKALSDRLAQQTGSEGPDARVGKLEERLKLMSEAAVGDPQAGKLPQIAALSGRIVDLETTLTNQLSALRQTVTQQVEQRLALTNETSEAAKSGTNRIDREVAALKSEAAATGQKVDTVRGDTERLSGAVQAIRDDSNALKTAVEGVRSEFEAKFKATAKPADVAQAIAPVAGKLTALEQSVQGVVKSEEDRKLNAERIVLALELNNLKRAIERGQKYASELAEVGKASSGKFDLAILERYKDTGIATLADLARDFRPVAGAILDAQVDKGDGSVVDRIVASAKSVIRVRKTTHAPDDKSPEAIISRMETGVREGRLADVLAESKNLPPKGADSAHDWLVKVEARGAVDRAIAGLEAALKSSITGTAPAPVPGK